MKYKRNHLGLILGVGLTSMYAFPTNVLAFEYPLLEISQFETPSNSDQYYDGDYSILPSNSNKNSRQCIDDNCTASPRVPNLGDGFCGISPGDRPDTSKTWSRQPLFIWRGTIIEMRLRGRLEDSDLPWTPNINPGQHTITYDGEQPLESGYYRIHVRYLEDDGTEARDELIFEVISDEEYLAVEAELNRINQETVNPDEAARLRAQYFIERGLWMDALREYEQIAPVFPHIRSDLDSYYESTCPSE